MHIHIQNDSTGIDQPITQKAWEAAGIPGYEVTIGNTVEAFNAQAASMDFLIAAPWRLRHINLFSAPKLKMLQTTSAGVDMLAPFDMIPPDVLLVNNRGTHAARAHEYALMAILMLVNKIPRFVTDQRAGVWNRVNAGMAARQRLTVIGLGALGGAAASAGRYLGMDVTGLRHGNAPHADCTRTLNISALDEVLPQTDILFLACPLTPETTGLFSAARLAMLPEGAGVVNIGRGRLVDQAALFDALDAGRLGGAVLDVFEKEPLRAGDRAWGVKNLVITPHMSADDPDSYNALTLAIFKKNLTAYLEGKRPPCLVDREKMY